MSFDPLRKQSGLWKNFPMSELTIPTYLIVKNKDDYFFTVNMYIEACDEIDHIVKRINDVKMMLIAETDKFIQSKQKIVYQIEKDPESWKASVQKAVDTINDNLAEKIVLARELRIKLNERVKVGRLIRKLIASQQQSYIFA